MRVRDFGRACLLLCALFWFAGPARAQTREADFTRQMAERFRAAFPGREVDITEPLQLRIALTPDPALVNVGRLYNFCASAPAPECEASIDRFVASAVDGLSDLAAPIAREQLRLLVRNIEYCDSLRPAGASEQPAIIIRPFVPGLCTLLMADFPTTMRGVTAEEVRGMNLEPDAAWALAERQTLADLPRPSELEGLRDSIVAVTDFDYVTSLMLDLDGWRVAADEQGELVVAVPASNMIIVSRRANLTDLPSFRAAVREQMDTAERGVSPNLYRWTPAGWAPLE